MDYWFLMIAAFLSLAGMLIHGFIGGKIYISNVNDSDMEALTKSLSIACLAGNMIELKGLYLLENPPIRNLNNPITVELVHNSD